MGVAIGPNPIFYWPLQMWENTFLSLPFPFHLLLTPPNSSPLHQGREPPPNRLTLASLCHHLLKQTPSSRYHITVRPLHQPDLSATPSPLLHAVSIFKSTSTWPFTQLATTTVLTTMCKHHYVPTIIKSILIEKEEGNSQRKYFHF